MSKQNAEKDGRKSALAGAASAVLAHKAPKNVLGYEKVYHGTNHNAAAAIKKTGLKKSKSGSGVAAVDVNLGRATHAEVKGKVYTTRQKAVADFHQPKMGNYSTGQTLTARVPYRSNKRLAKDVVIERIAAGTDPVTKTNHAQQALARGAKEHLRIYRHSISPRFIEGGHKYGGRRQFATVGNMRRYLSQAGGKARFAKGLAQAAGSAGAGMYAVAKALKAHRENKK